MESFCVKTNSDRGNTSSKDDGTGEEEWFTLEDGGVYKRFDPFRQSGGGNEAKRENRDARSQGKRE